VFAQIFLEHSYSGLYSLFESHESLRILDAGKLEIAPDRLHVSPCNALPCEWIHEYAGANAGYSTLLFTLLWPNATIVALEPDPANFGQLSTMGGMHRRARQQVPTVECVLRESSA
jgi:hypothetical protein